MQNNIDKLIELFSSFPAIGKKTATRIVLNLISQKKNLITDLAKSLNDVYEQIKICEVCHNIDVISPCSICKDVNRVKNVICIVENIEDLWAIEKTGNYKGIYHILGGVLSAVKGIFPENLNIKSLEYRIENNQIDEIILAINSAIEGQTTIYYLLDILENFNVKITKLGYGLPLGSEIGYLDEGTINAAFESRKEANNKL